jgi:hypothetical protein
MQPSVKHPATAQAQISEVQVNPDIKLRQMIYRPAHAKGTVLFLHGFPETNLCVEADCRVAVQRLRSACVRLAWLWPILAPRR